MKKCPCKECTDRKLMCHCSCEAYKAWKAEREEMLKVKQESQQLKQLSRDHELKYRKNIRWGARK